MRIAGTTRGSSHAALRAVLLLVVVAALITPKVSLALATALGHGYTSVVICTGGSLARVTIDADGKIIDDVSERWSASHCVLLDPTDERHVRAWQRIRWPQLGLVPGSHTNDDVALPREVRPAALERAPPVV